MTSNDETAELRAEVERWREKAQESGAAYANANSKHHAELDRANRLERMAETLAEKAVDLEDRARAAEAKVARVEALAERWAAQFDEASRSGQTSPVHAALLGAAQAIDDALAGDA